METLRIDFVINAGEDWSTQLWFNSEYDEPMKVTHPLRMDVKDGTGSTVVSLASSLEPPDFGNPIPEISFNTDVGLIQLHLTTEVTDALVAGSYIYDLFGHVDDEDEYAGDQVVRFCAGTVHVRKRITETF